MVEVYRTCDVTGWVVHRPEPLGRERKNWVHEPGLDPGNDPSCLWLFKPVVIPKHGRPQGEDWAEKIASELAVLLAVPCAEVDLAVRSGARGSISRNVAPDGWDLSLGPQLLTRFNPSYIEGREQPPGRPGHSVEAVMAALSECDGPLSGPLDLSATEVFAGFLVFDAWIANQDRHDQNWAVLDRTAAQGSLRLAPSFDHAGSLASNRDDTYRRTLLDGRRVAAWAAKGRAHRFEHDPSQGKSGVQTLVDAAHRGLRLAGPRASAFWLDRLAAVSSDHIWGILERVPEMSDTNARFILELLTVNQGRLLREH